MEDLFKEPEATPAKPADEVDDLFKDLDETPSGNKAAASEPQARPKLIDSCCIELAMVLAMLASPGATSA